MKKTVLILNGDGIGPEVTTQGAKVLRLMAPKAGIELDLQDGLIGAAALEVTGEPLPDETFAKAKGSDAILFGAVGDPRYDKAGSTERPGRGLLTLRKQLQLYANLRPAKVLSATIDASPLKRERIEGVDLMIVRELTGDIYFGEPRGRREEAGQKVAINTMIYSEPEIERIVRFAFGLARQRRHKLTSVDKGNVLEVSAFWREIAIRVAKDFTDVEFGSMYVDNAAMQIIRDPRQFDTMVMGNMFGDILSDAAANLSGSLGMLPSASLGDRYALYEPCHGSAPDIAGRDVANPIASILSVGMMFRYTFGKPDADDAIQSAVDTVLSTHRTADIMAPGKQQVGCSEMGDLIARQLEG
ncbi:MAG TPA: 3-isopropylmalate dehydrogenase [bacterium]|nr:3-isopropylmalate dehydrogenase [bacterium]